MNVEIQTLREGYLQGTLSLDTVFRYVKERIDTYQDHHIWIHVLDEEALAPYLENLKDKDPNALPLYGIPFAIKDNIDLAGVPTTAGCKEYRYVPTTSAYAVERLIEMGAVPVGKTNLDQFATGLVGTRSPYGACKNAIDPDYISGGSSSVSAVSVALEMVSFSLGTDTAGSGRVPAAFNNIIGLKASKGVVSTSGVVPACRSLDCVTVFAKTLACVKRVFDVVNCYDEADVYSRPYVPSRKEASPLFTFAVPQKDQLAFFGDEAAKELFFQAVERFESLGGTAVEVDFRPFIESANLLYSGPWVSERFIAIKELITQTPEVLDKTIRTIISQGETIDAVNYFESEYCLKKHRKSIDKLFATYAFLVTPTTGTIYTIDEVNANPIELNTNLGYYTNFMNLLDLCAIALPAGVRDNGLPFGVTIVGDAFDENMLLAYASRYLKENR